MIGGGPIIPTPEGRVTDMDNGEYVKGEITITPAMNGSYLVRRNWYGDKEGGPYRINPVAEMVCFSNYRDMLKFLSADYEMAHASLNAGAESPEDGFRRIMENVK